MVRCQPAPPSQRFQFVVTITIMAIVTMNTRIRHENSKTLFQSSEVMVLKGLRAVVVAEASRVRPGQSLHGRHRSASRRKILGKDHVYPRSGIGHRLKGH